MEKPKKTGLGSSTAKPNPATTQQIANPYKNHTSLEQQALALINQGKLKESEEIYRSLITSGTNNHLVYENLAAICGIQGRWGDATRLLKQTLQLKPNYPEAHNNLGIALKGKGDLTAAIAAYKQAIQLKPNSPEAHYNLGNALIEQDEINAAIDSYNKALALKPNYSEAHNNLGNALIEQDEINAAIDSYNKALALKPNYPEAHNNLGFALKENGDLTAAIDSYNKAIALKPDYPDAHWNLSITMLLGGDYKSGWEKYEWRSKKKNPILPSAQPNCSRWDGITPEPGNQLLLVSEQGLGDTLQFMRYAIALRNQGIAVSLCAPPKLHSLIQASGIDSSPLNPEQANTLSEGKWSPLLTVPGYLEVSPDNPIITEPYIKTTDELITKWKDILSAEQRPIVGINWKGNRSDNKKKERNIALEKFAALTYSSNITLLSLQRGATSEEIDSCSFSAYFAKEQPKIHEISGSDLDSDFLEYAAIIANCDLVLTTATTLAHLAGGMSKRTWTLIPSSPEWRWGLKGDTSFWYPSMRLFRQKERGDWDEVLQQVTRAINKEFPNQTPQAQEQKGINQ